MTDDATSKQGPDVELIRMMFREAGELIKRLEGSSVVRLAVEAAGYKVELERGSAGATIQLAMSAAQPAVAASAGATQSAVPDNRFAVTAPLVGTFYRSPQPGAKPFVEVGDTVDQGQPLAIVEAMKIMNQIVAEQRGRVAEILVEAGEWVEFQQVLMYLEPIEA